MKQEDIIILQLIKELLEDNTSMEVLEGMLDDNILAKINSSQSVKHQPQSQELKRLEAQNKQLLERLDSQTSMTELGMNHLMQELKELKEKCTDMMPQQNSENSNISEERKMLAQERRALDEERNRLESLAKQLQIGKQNIQSGHKSQVSSQDWKVLQNNLLANEEKLIKYFPQSFIFNSSISGDDNLIWIGEKMGLNYVVIANCKNSVEIQNTTLVLLLNAWLNHIILESKFRLDVEEIFKEINRRLDNLGLQNNLLKLGVSVVDYLNSSISFVGIGVDFWKQKSGEIQISQEQFASFKHIGQIQQIRKKVLPIEHKSSFMMTFINKEDNRLKQNLQTMLNEGGGISNISTQKHKIEQLLHEFQNFIILGFKA